VRLILPAYPLREVGIDGIARPLSPGFMSPQLLIRSGASSASAMLKRLSVYPRQNGLAVALREIGRIERSLFTMDWLKSPELRRRAHAGLNKGEARNALARAIFFHSLGELRDRSF